MTSTLLYRINPEKNERRFYLVMSGPTLFEAHAVTRCWGRIGGWQRSMVTACATADEAEKVAGKLVEKKLKRGYTKTTIPERTRR